MRPISLEFQAFGPYAGKERIDFNDLSRKGLLLICGDTGSGKTMILDAMTLALYGKASGGYRNDFSTMRCNRCAPEDDTYIEFVFEAGGNIYKFERRLTMKRVNLSESQQIYRMDESGRFEPVKEKLNKTEMPEFAKQFIGFDYDQFTQVVVLPQGKFEQFLVSDSGKKGEILNEIFGAEKWGRTASRYYDLVKTEYDDLNARRDRVISILGGENCGDLEMLKEKIRLTEEELAQLDRRYEEADLHTRQNRLRHEMETAERLKKLRNDLELRQKDISEAEQTTDACTADLEASEAKCTDHKNRESEKAAWNQEKISLESKKELYRNAEKVRKSFDNADQEWKRACHAADQADKTLERYRKKEKRAYEEYQKAELEHRAAMDAFARGAAGRLAADLKEGEKCPVCGSTHHPEKAEMGEDAVSSAEVDRKREALAAKGDDWEATRRNTEIAQKEAEQAKQNQAAAENIRSAAENALRDSRSGMADGIGDLKALEGRIADLGKSIAAFDRKREELTQSVETCRIRLAEARTAKAKAEEEAAKTETEYSAVKKILEETRGSAEMPEAYEIEKQLKQIDDQIAMFRREQGSLAANIERMSGLYADLMEEQKVYRDRIPEVESALAFARKLRGENSIGLERYVLKIMFTQVVQAANEMLRNVHGGRYSLMITEESTGSSRKKGLDLAVMDSFSTSGELRPAHFLSGGEKFLVSLALSIGMSTIARTDGINIEAMFIDEGFGSLDENSIGDALEVLESIRGGADSFIGIISHVQILRDSIPSKLIVHKGRKTSTIEYSMG